MRLYFSFLFMLIDDVTIKISAGKGGDGAVAFNKNLMSLGPAGGSGGNGGNVYFEGVSDLSALGQFRFKKEINAQDGQRGKPQFCDGRTGEDLVLKVPVGTVIHNITTKADEEIIKIRERLLAAKGGRGGKGNFLFRSSRNTTPEEFQVGLPGQDFTLRLELKLIADVGFVGLPNVGKSSLLNELTNANTKVANYPFTTLEPNLGVYYDLILADIPGLIEGASKGKGLGDKFLRHIERTKILFHFISSESKDLWEDYQIIRKELVVYNRELVEKMEYIFLSKSDAVDAQTLKNKISVLKEKGLSATPISIYDYDSVKAVEKILNEIAARKISG